MVKEDTEVRLKKEEETTFLVVNETLRMVLMNLYCLNEDKFRGTSLSYIYKELGNSETKLSEEIRRNFRLENKLLYKISRDQELKQLISRLVIPEGNVE